VSVTPQRIVVGISGASGSVYGLRLLQVLKDLPGYETHLVITDGGAETIRYELQCELSEVQAWADHVHSAGNLAAGPSSGSFLTAGMVVAPCSIGSLSGIANSANTNLLVRAADVHLKEHRRLVLLVRETPLHIGHLRLMVAAAEAGAVILPPVPAFYTRPDSVQDIVDHTVGKALDLLGVEHDLFTRWTGN
jgi:polyprenyl P-hydroxybenzoate/phenylacrylic acid decarboxylase-like protein